MKVVWSPLIRELKLNPPYYKNIWFIPSKHEAWMEPHRFRSIADALDSLEEPDCIRVAIVELTD